jgi:hypothetical protein
VSAALAVVQFGEEPMLGVVFAGDGDLCVIWEDDHADMVFRDRRGWFWDEYGDTAAPTGSVARPDTRDGTRLRVVSRKKADIAAVTARFSGAA